MKWRRADPMRAAAIAEARAAETRAEVDRARAMADLRREQRAADDEAARAREVAAEQDRLRREANAQRRREARTQVRKKIFVRARLLAPLLIVNLVAVGGQVAYALAEVAPPDWLPIGRLSIAAGFALALESVSLYVNWHAHDALLNKAYATAARLRRAAYSIAAVMGSLNYSHFAGPGLMPSAAAIGFGLSSLLSPWLWGLHTRRMQHVQLLREDLVDETGAEFDMARRRAFPFRTWAARRWSIDNNVRDPRQAWAGYKAERAARRAEVRSIPTGRVRTAWAVLRGKPQASPAEAERAAVENILAEMLDIRADVRRRFEALHSAPGDDLDALISVLHDPAAALSPGNPGRLNGHHPAAATAASVAVGAAPELPAGDTTDRPEMADSEPPLGGLDDRQNGAAVTAKTPASSAPDAPPNGGPGDRHDGGGDGGQEPATEDAKPPAKTAPRSPTRRAQTTADKVARAAAKMPGATAAEIARKVGVGETTARRHLARQNGATSTANEGPPA